MQSRQQGFTIIELVVVIVILGILAATAIPKFIDLRTEANDAAAAGIAGGLSSASAINYAGCSAIGNTNTTGKCTPLSAGTATCSSVGTLMVPAMTLATTVADPTVQGALYVKADTTLTTAGVTCTLVYGNGKTGGVEKTFIGLATGS